MRFRGSLGVFVWGVGVWSAGGSPVYGDVDSTVPVEIEFLPGQSLGDPFSEASWLFLEDEERGGIRGLRLSRRMELPVGRWRVHAEGEGWIALGPEPLALRRTKKPQALKLRPVPACAAELEASPAWQGVERVEVASQKERFAFRVDRKARGSFQVPEGRVGLAFFRGGELLGISSRLKCEGGQRLRVSPPRELPEGWEQTLVRWRDPEGFTGSGGVEVGIVPAGFKQMQPVQLPELVVPLAGGGLAYFAERGSVDGTLKLLASGRRSYQLPVRRASRTVQHRVVPLQPLVDLALEVEYQPKRKHNRAEVELYRCGAVPVSGFTPFQRFRQRQCQRVGVLGLQVGRNPLRFRGLDTGQYVMNAWIGEEHLLGLGRDLAPALSQEASEFAPLPKVLLREFEIYGSFLVDGKPYPGELVIEGLESPDAPVSHFHRFPTDEHGVYHFYYFGRSVDEFAEYPDFPFVKELLSLPEKDRLGAPSTLAIATCLQDRGCRWVAKESFFVGEGRLDFELKLGGTLQIRVLDAVTGSALRAGVSVSGRVGQFVFLWGEKKPVPAPDGFGAYVTNGEGELILQFPAGREYRLEIDGGLNYVPKEISVRLEKEERRTLEVRLERAKPSEEGALFQAGEKPLGDARLYWIREVKGPFQPYCMQASEETGRLKLGERCDLAGAKGALLVHPGVGLKWFDREELNNSQTYELDQAGEVRFRVVDVEGQPLEGVEVTLERRELELNREFLWHLHINQRFSFSKSDASGWVTLPPLHDPEDWTLVLSREDRGRVRFRLRELSGPEVMFP